MVMLFHIPTGSLVFNAQETGSPLAVHHFCGSLKPSKQTRAQDVVSVCFWMAKQVARTYYSPRSVFAHSQCLTREANDHFKDISIRKPPFEIKNYIE